MRATLTLAGINLDPCACRQAIDMFRERLSHYGMKTIVAPGQVMP
jgi:hypothetical protein